MKFSIVNIGTNTGASGATLAITVGAAGVPVGSTIFVLVTEKSTSGTSGTLADTAGNTYATITSGNLAALAADGRATLFAVTNCKALVNTNTITYTRNLSAASCAMSAFYVSGATGAATFTEGVATATGTTGTITVTSGSLGAGRLVLGALFASGTSTAGGNATFTNAASFVTPPNEATTGGSGGSRVDGGTLFKAASGTQVYNPTLSSTAQQWLLAVVGIIPAPDTLDWTDPNPAQPRPLAKPTDFPNLLLTTLAPPPFVDNTKIFRTPIFARLPDRLPPARQEYVANLLPFQSMAPTGVPPAPLVDQPTGGQRPKAIVDTVVTIPSLLTPNPARPFSQSDWLRPPGLPKAIGEAVGTLSPLLTPNPARPFSQSDWFQIIPRQKAKVDDPLNLTPFLPAPVVTVQFSQLDWPRAATPLPVAKPTDQQNLLTSTLAPAPPVLNVIFRSPLIARLPDAWPKAKVDDPGNLTIQLPVVVVTVAFKQLDWPLPARPLAKQADTSIAASAPLYTPNPPIPFNQDLWDSATRSFPKVVGEVVATLSPLLTPNPAIPFNQYEWRSTARVPLSLKSDVYFGAFSLYSPNPPIPFNQDLWENAARTPPRAVGEPLAGISALLTPNPSQPFSQFDWFQIRSTQKAKVDDPGNLTIYLTPVVVTVQFKQLDWPNPALARAKIGGDFSVAGPLPLYAPNPAQPFSQSDWPRIFTTSRAKVDDFVNLLPVQTVVVVFAPFYQNDWLNAARAVPPQKSDVYGGSSALVRPNPAQPFNQDVWDSALKGLPKAGGEVTGILSPVLTPNPTQPFSQKIWDSATPPKPKAYADPAAAISALYNPNPARPFSQSIWDSATRAWPKAVGEATGGILALLAPNPAQPFSQSDWTRVLTTSKAKVDDFAYLQPLYSVVVVAAPFHQNDWSTVAQARAAQKSDVYRGPNPLLTPNPAQPFAQRLWENATRLPPLKSIGDVLASPNPIIYPNPSRPFSQGDWPTTARSGPADRSFSAAVNLPLITPPPPPPPPSIGIGAAIGAYPKWRRLS